MPKIPYGISNFERIRRDDYLYIDKTNYIEILESYGEPYLFLLRPRRFGKTLFLSTLKYYYDLHEKDRFDELFGGLYIGRNKTALANSYYILEFDFSGITTETRDKMKELFAQKVRGGIRSFIEKYSFDIEISDSDEPAGIIHDFNVDLTNIIREKGHRVYLLMDEYDHFANDILGQELEEFQRVVGETGFVRLFFEALKESTASKEIIERMFVTGVSPITLDSMTSGFNIAKKKTTDTNLNAMMGFTEDELKYLLNRVMTNYDMEGMLSRLKEYYDGYLFSPKAVERIYHTDMILYYASEFLIDGEEPKDLIDVNISSDYSRLQKLFELKNREQNYAILADILSGHEQKGKITTEYNLLGSFSKRDFISLLFYMGLLTIKREELGFIYFDVPNYAVKEIYYDYFMEIISRKVPIDAIEVESTVVDLLKDGEITGFIEKVEGFLSGLSNRDFMRFEEKYIKIVMLTYFRLSNICIVKSEYEVRGGYIDIALLRRDDRVKYEVLLEIKYIKISDFDRHGAKVVQERLSDAKNQLNCYAQAEEFKDRKDLKKWAMVFVGPKTVVVEEV